MEPRSKILLPENRDKIRWVFFSHDTQRYWSSYHFFKISCKTAVSSMIFLKLISEPDFPVFWPILLTDFSGTWSSQNIIMAEIGQRIKELQKCRTKRDPSQKMSQDCKKKKKERKKEEERKKTDPDRRSEIAVW